MWETVKLGDVVSFDKKNGKDSGLPYLGMENISSESMRLVGEIEVPDSTSSTFIFDDSHVLYGRLRPYLKKVLLPDFEGQCSTEIFCLKPSEDLLRGYLSYWLLNPKTAAAIEETSTGARMPRANMNAILNFEIFLPPLAEQQRIVAKLDAAFAEIDRAIELEATRIGAMNQLKASTLFNKFSELKDECKELHLSEVCDDFSRGKSKHRPRNDERLYGDTVPFVQTGDVTNASKYLSTYSKMYSEFGIQQSKIWRKGTVCITIAANIAELAILDMDACFPDSVIGAFPNENITSSEYLFYLLNFFQKKIKAKGKGAAQQNINLATFSDESFPFPSLNKQKEITSSLSEVEARIDRVTALKQEKINALLTLKSSVLAQELQPPQSEAA